MQLFPMPSTQPGNATAAAGLAWNSFYRPGRENHVPLWLQTLTPPTQKGWERETRREAGLLAKGVRHTGLTNLSSKVQRLARETWSDSFIDHKPQNDSQFLMVGGILKLFSLTSCLPEAAPHVRQGAEGEVLGVSSRYKVHRIQSPL